MAIVHCKLNKYLRETTRLWRKKLQFLFEVFDLKLLLLFLSKCEVSFLTTTWIGTQSRVKKSAITFMKQNYINTVFILVIGFLVPQGGRRKTMRTSCADILNDVSCGGTCDHTVKLCTCVSAKGSVTVYVLELLAAGSFLIWGVAI